jgi:hypothetical protein
MLFNSDCPRQPKVTEPSQMMKTEACDFDADNLPKICYHVIYNFQLLLRNTL